jgi:hypothetical protein
MNPSPSVRPVPGSADDPERVTIEDLKHTDAISELLFALNDASAGADILGRHIAKIRPLKARIAKRFAVRYPNRSSVEIAQQVALLGNRELETILLSLLEDVVVLNSEVGPVPPARRSDPPPGSTLKTRPSAATKPPGPSSPSRRPPPTRGTR